MTFRCTKQGFWYFARSRSREFQVNPRNPAKFTKTREILRNSLEILPNTCRHNIFESYLGCWGCLLALNLLIYHETSSPQGVNSIKKLPGVLRLMLRKTRKQRCKNPGGNWGWEFIVCSLFVKMLRFVKDYVPVKSKLQHPPGATPGHLNFWEVFVQIPPFWGRKAVQMPHHRWSFQVIKCPHPGKLFGSFYYAPEAVYVNMV